MKSCTILHTESSPGWGGQEIRILTESAGMIERGHKVIIACQPDAVIAKRAEEQGIETITMRIGGATDFAAIRQLSAIMRNRGVDIVNTHSSKDSWSAGIAAKFAGRTKVIRTRHLSIPVKKGLVSKYPFLNLPDAVVTTGEALRERLIEEVGIPPMDIVSIPTGIDLSRFDPEKADGSRFRAEIGIPGDAPLVGSVGMLRVMKGHKYLIDAVAQAAKTISDIRLVIVGDTAFASDIKEQLAAQTADLGMKDRIIMLGYREDIPDILAELDLFVLASIRSEGVPQVINQAMAMKKPVVATDVGSVREQAINGETGFLVEPADSDQIAKAIITLIGDPERASRMGENGRKLVEEKFNLESMLDATESLYERLLGS